MTDQTNTRRTRTRTDLPGRQAAKQHTARRDEAAPNPTPEPMPANPISIVHTEPLTIAGDRSIKYRWPIRSVTDPHHGDGTLYAELTIGHSTHSKQLSASLAPTTVYANGWGTTSYRLTRPHWQRRQPVPRYTAKRLAAFAADTLTQFRADVDTRHPAILDVFEVTE